MNNTVSEVMAFTRENDVQFVRLAFCDVFGTQKNISIPAAELAAAFEHGVSFDASAIRGFSDVTKSDLFLFPDPLTLTVLPWRPGPGHVVRFYCDIRNPDGTAFASDSRLLLKRIVERAAAMGYVCKIGAECEFYLFKTDENGDATSEPLDRGTYLDIAPLDKGENMRREICLSLEEMGIQPESSHHEQGPGQNEIDFKFDGALASADNILTVKSVVKAIASRNGLFASFMPKPIATQAGSGMHINLSLEQNGKNIFRNRDGGHSAVAESFIAGVLEKAAEITLFLNPLANSYERLGVLEAPRYVSWSHQNRSQLVRIPAASGKHARMELRSPDPSANSYHAFALIIAAGLYGIENALTLPTSIDADLYTAPESVTDALTRLPKTLTEAIAAASASALVKDVIGAELASLILELKREEDAAFKAAEDKRAFYAERYFNYI